VPSVVITAAEGQADPTGSNPLSFRVVFDQPVSGFAASDVSIAGTASVGSASAVVTATADPAVYLVEVSGVSGAGSVVVAVPAGSAINVFSQPNTASNTASVDFDGVGPVATVDLNPGQADRVGRVPIKFVVRFDEPVTGFTADDVVSGGTADPSGVTVSGSGAEYVVTVARVAGNGTVVIDVVDGAVSDALGNGSTTVSAANSVTFAAPVDSLPDTGNRGFPFREALVLIFAGLLLVLISRRRRRDALASLES
jgi:hypothetical protein